MARPISSVQLGVARFFAEVTDRTTDAELAAWVRSFARSLAFQRPGLNEYADELMQDVESYRRAESARKRGELIPADSVGFHRIPPESAGIQDVPSDSEHSQSVSQSPSNPSKKKKKAPRAAFAAPSVDEVRAYCEERGNSVNPEQFVAHYEANGWVQGNKGKPIVNWKAAVVTWEGRRSFGSAAAGRPAKPVRKRVEHAENLSL